MQRMGFLERFLLSCENNELKYAKKLQKTCNFGKSGPFCSEKHQKLRSQKWVSL